MAYGTVNADVIQSSVTGVSLGAGNATVFKNRIINGDMRIDQRNAGAAITPTNLQFSVDRWALNLSQASKFTAQQNAGSVTPPAGFSNYLGITSSSAYSVLAGDYFGIYQLIEGFNFADMAWGTANAKTVTLSAWVRSSLTGTFGGSLFNSGQNYCYPFSYSISTANTWTQISVTIAGPTAGTWVGSTNGAGVGIQFNLGTGTTYSGTAGSWAAATYVSATGATSVVGTSSATFYITGVQLEVGSLATGFEYNDYGRQLAQCQRYYTTNLRGNGFVTNSTTDCALFLAFPVTMRTTPTMGVTGVVGIYTGSANVAQSSASAGSFFGNSQGGMVIPSNFSGLAAFYPVSMNTNASPYNYTATAEL
jgi:hypothetical protein